MIGIIFHIITPHQPVLLYIDISIVASLFGTFKVIWNLFTSYWVVGLHLTGWTIHNWQP